jgi:hypothetical protein
VIPPEDRGIQCPAKSAKVQRLGELQSSGVRSVTIVAGDLWAAEVEIRHRLEGEAREIDGQKRAYHAFGGVLDETISDQEHESRRSRAIRNGSVHSPAIVPAEERSSARIGDRTSAEADPADLAAAPPLPARETGGADNAPATSPMATLVEVGRKAGGAVGLNSTTVSEGEMS